MTFPVKIQKRLQQYNVKTLHQFGSTLSKGIEQANDVDLLVEFHTSVGLWKLNALQRLLEEYFHKPIDLLTKNGISPYIAKEIEIGKQLIYEKQ